MKYVILIFLFLFSCLSYAQGVKQADLVGKWHFSKIKTNGVTVVDINNPKAGQEAALKLMKQRNPNFTTEDEKTTIEHAKKMQESSAKMYITFNRDGTYEATHTYKVIDPNLKPETGVYKIISNGTELTQKMDGNQRVDTIGIHMQNDVLSFYNAKVDATFEFIK